ncbi:hypothetical protein [Streptomyces sp. NPDC005805]|uniref:hypothetical protein n=1 Tax=Streptomyces sp. NPDC005805 TaxID=3157068 RepID=UPI003406E8B4
MSDDADLQPLTDRLAELHRGEVLRTVTHTFDGARFRGDPALGDGAWIALGGVSGSDRAVAATWSDLRTALLGLGRSALVDAEVNHPVLRTLADLLGGEPTDWPLTALSSPFGSAFTVEAFDRSSAGTLLCLPTASFDGASTRRLVDHVRTVGTAFGFSPGISLNAMNEQTVQATVDVSFDRSEPDRVEAAHACLDELQRVLWADGFHPYRVGVQTLERLPTWADPFWRTTARLKHALDPTLTIPPGTTWPNELVHGRR